ncbi:MAG: ribosome assembly factor SBDS [archaeon]
MSQLEDKIVARLDKDGHHFEILVDPYLADDLKHGKDVDFQELLAIDQIFFDSRKGKEISGEVLKEVFPDMIFNDIIKFIITKGEVQLTTEQKHKMMETRKKEIINFITTNAHDPKNMSPIPEMRVINAMEELKFKINLNKTKDQEIKELIQHLMKLFPISLEEIILDVEVPAIYSGKINAALHQYKLVEERWLPNGSLFAKLKMPVGQKQNVISKLNNLTHGSIVIRVEGE